MPTPCHAGQCLLVGIVSRTEDIHGEYRDPSRPRPCCPTEHHIMQDTRRSNAIRWQHCKDIVSQIVAQMKGRVNPSLLFDRSFTNCLSQFWLAHLARSRCCRVATVGGYSKRPGTRNRHSIRQTHSLDLFLSLSETPRIPHSIRNEGGQC